MANEMRLPPLGPGAVLLKSSSNSALVWWVVKFSMALYSASRCDVFLNSSFGSKDATTFALDTDSKYERTKLKDMDYEVKKERENERMSDKQRMA